MLLFFFGGGGGGGEGRGRGMGVKLDGLDGKNLLPASPVDETLIELSCQIANMCYKSLRSILSSETLKLHALKQLNPQEPFRELVITKASYYKKWLLIIMSEKMSFELLGANMVD